jgi:hypothetical protein
MTMKELNNQASDLHNLAVDLGIIKDGEGTRLTEGSKVNGIAFRLSIKKPNSSAHHRHPLGDYLGMTKPEASAAIHWIVNTLHVVKDAQR